MVVGLDADKLFFRIVVGPARTPISAARTVVETIAPSESGLTHGAKRRRIRGKLERG